MQAAFNLLVLVKSDYYSRKFYHSFIEKLLLYWGLTPLLGKNSYFCTMITPKLSVIISTYNQPEWLEKVLWGYEAQTETDFEVIIADDGSSEETKNFIENFKKQSPLTIIHVWHADDGFRKTVILNKAILASTSEYLLFTDGDCIPRADFVEVHLKNREKGYCLSGGYFKLPMEISEKISEIDVKNKSCFDLDWLRDNGLENSFKVNKLTSWGLKARLLNKFTPTKATFDGMNASGWKSDILAVNGFDERMLYGGEDRELGERLMNNGIKFKQIRYSAICVHLFHGRPYKNDADVEFNKSLRKKTKQTKSVYTPFGIRKDS